ncbi:MAG: oxidoreductase [Actinobacteria bacterium 69-20]|nr:aldo/keto reductase [Actinomycetota bacterium]OJV27616.1 MAG: oxidoreductase [Actinobacteria bacterium 69-20]
MTTAPTPDATAPDVSAAGTITIGGDLTVNRLGFGAMRITGQGIWGEPDDIDEAKAVLRRAVECGVTLIDTADSYGPHVSENLIREALAPYPANLVIATKGGLERPDPYKWTDNSSRSHLRDVCHTSLMRLGLEQIPLYQWHRPDPKVPLEDAIGTLMELQKEGKIKHLGVSNVTLDQLQQISSMTTIVSVQNRFNMGTRGSEAIVDYCAANGLAFIPWAPIHDFADTPAVREIAERHGATSRQLVLAWLLARSPAMLPIPGTGSLAHLDENLRAASIALTEEEVSALTRAAS